MVKLISVAALCVGMVAGAPAAAEERPVFRMRHTVYWTVRAVPAPVPCTTDSDCERKNGGPVTLNSRPVYRT